MGVYWKMNNMNKGSKWSKYKNRATGDIIEARPNTKFPEYRLLRWDEGVFGGVKTCTSMLVTDFEKGYIKVKQRYFYVVYQYDKGGVKYAATSYSITDNGSHFNLNLFVSNVEKYENGTSVIVTNFIEFKTEKDFMDFKGDRL